MNKNICKHNSSLYVFSSVSAKHCSLCIKERRRFFKPRKNIRK